MRRGCVGWSISYGRVARICVATGLVKSTLLSLVHLCTAALFRVPCLSTLLYYSSIPVPPVITLVPDLAAYYYQTDRRRAARRHHVRGPVVLRGAQILMLIERAWGSPDPAPEFRESMLVCMSRGLSCEHTAGLSITSEDVELVADQSK
jgi:hypothetical protein